MKTIINRSAWWRMSLPKINHPRNQKPKVVLKANEIITVFLWRVRIWEPCYNSRRNNWKRIIIKCTCRDLRRPRSKSWNNKSFTRHMRTLAMLAKCDCISRWRMICLTGASCCLSWVISSWLYHSYCLALSFSQWCSIVTLLYFQQQLTNLMQEGSFQLQQIVLQRTVGCCTYCLYWLLLFV